MAMMNAPRTKKQSRPVYEKPEIRKAEKMTFMFEPFKKGVSNVACRQCSGCHGCR